MNNQLDLKNNPTEIYKGLLLIKPNWKELDMTELLSTQACMHADRTRNPKLRNLALFYTYRKMPESGLTNIPPLMCPSPPVFLHPEFPQGTPWGVAAV